MITTHELLEGTTKGSARGRLSDAGFAGPACARNGAWAAPEGRGFGAAAGFAGRRGVALAAGVVAELEEARRRSPGWRGVPPDGEELGLTGGDPVEPAGDQAGPRRRGGAVAGRSIGSGCPGDIGRQPGGVRPPDGRRRRPGRPAASWPRRSTVTSRPSGVRGLGQDELARAGTCGGGPAGLSAEGAGERLQPVAGTRAACS